MDLLEKISLLEKDAAQFGFRWENTSQIMEQIKSEYFEVSEQLNNTQPAHLQEEIGDLLHAVFSLCVFCQFDPKETLNLTLNKFERRLEAVKQLASERGLATVEGFAFNELMALWEEAKKITQP